MSGMRRARQVGWLLPLAVGVFEAVRRAWLCDDIYISFRYVDHLLHGQGLVFNAGERVEGFTHFLWVMILAAGARLGLDLVTLGRYLSIVAFAALLAVLWRRASATGLFVPIAAWGVALHLDAQIYASSGMETMPFALLLLLALLAVAGENPRPGLAACLYAGATLMRPEGVLYTATAALCVLLQSRSFRAVVRFLCIWLALIVPFLVFRIAYYGDLLPNTYYAKSAAGSNWHQGWLYTRLYFSIYAVLVLAVAAIAIAWMKALRMRCQDNVAWLAGLQCVLTILYVTRLGGDFMFARFFVPITPLLYLLLEDVGRGTGKRWVQVVLAGLVVGATLYARVPQAQTFVGRERVNGIVNEANYYDARAEARLRRAGEIMGRALAGTGARVALLPGQDAVAYHGRFAYALEQNGLTDAEIAKRPLAERGRPGHEKGATYEDLLRRRIHFRLRPGATINLRLHQQVRFDDLYGEIVRYDTPLMEMLRGRPGVNFVPFPTYLQGYFVHIPSETRPRLVADYEHFQLFYFEHNHDPELLRRYRDVLLAAGVPAAELSSVDARVVEFRKAWRMDEGPAAP